MRPATGGAGAAEGSLSPSWCLASGHFYFRVSGPGGFCQARQRERQGLALRGKIIFLPPLSSLLPVSSLRKALYSVSGVCVQRGGDTRKAARQL